MLFSHSYPFLVPLLLYKTTTRLREIIGLAIAAGVARVVLTPLYCRDILP